MAAASPQTILKLAAAQSTIFFRPSPHFLVCAVARDLGNWARLSDDNESELALRMEDGIDGLFALGLEHCGLTLERIRELHLMRFSIINPVTDIIDKCVGEQWYKTPRFWNGGASDAYTIDSDPSIAFFHLAIYGELFAPDFEPILNQDSKTRRLSVVTRLEYIKYCVPDFACEVNGRPEFLIWSQDLDPRRVVKPTGPYKPDESGGNEAGYQYMGGTHNLALTWTIKSSRWKPHWKRMREKAGPDFQDNMDDGWWYNAGSAADWRQRLWEDVMMCQGLEGLDMIRPDLQDAWTEKVKGWRIKIARLEREPDMTMVGRQATLEYPYLLGDLRICASGFVPGTL